MRYRDKLRGVQGNGRVASGATCEQLELVYT